HFLEPSPAMKGRDVGDIAGLERPILAGELQDVAGDATRRRLAPDDLAHIREAVARVDRHQPVSLLANPEPDAFFEAVAELPVDASHAGEHGRADEQRERQGQAYGCAAQQLRDGRQCCSRRRARFGSAPSGTACRSWRAAAKYESRPRWSWDRSENPRPV